LALTIECRPDHLFVSGDGLATLMEAQQHFRDLSALLARERKRGVGARVLVDLRAGSSESEEVRAHVTKAMAAIYRDDDRVAIIVASTLLKFQIQRHHTRPGSGVFVSQGAAEEFLFRQRPTTRPVQLAY
jgi:hypothetical protein